MEFIYFLRETVYLLLLVIQTAMLARAILSWIPIDENGKVTSFLYMLTEPIIIPVRMIFNRFDFFRNSPLDISFFIAGMILAFILMVL